MGEISEAAAKSINAWSNIASIVAATVTALAVYSAFWSSAVIKKYSDEKVVMSATLAAKAREETVNAQIDVVRAKKGAAVSRADAAKARSEATQISARLIATQSELRVADSINPLSDAQLHRLRHSLSGYVLPAGAVISTAAPDDREAEYIATQVDRVLTAAGIPRTFGEGADSYQPTGREKGRVVVAFGSAVPRETAQELAKRLSDGGLPASVVRLKPEADPDVEEVARDFIVLRLVATPKSTH